MVVSPKPPAHESRASMLDLVFDALPARLAVLDAGGGILKVNQAWIAHGGLLPAAGRTYHDICESLAVGHLTTERVKSGVLRVLQGQSPVFREECAHEGQRFTELTAVPLVGDTRRGVLLTLADVTARRQAEDARHSDRQLLDKIVENIPTSVHVKAVNDDLRIVLWNKAAEALYGVPRAEAIGRNVQDLWPADAAAAMAAADQALLRDGGRQEFPDRPAQTRHGDELLVHMRKVLIHDEAGVATHMLIIADDVTGQRRKEAGMRASEERFRSLVAMSSDWYWQQDAEFRFSFFSGDDAMGNVPFRSSTLGKPPWELPHREPVAGTWADHRAQLENRQSFRDFEYVYNPPGAAPAWLSVNGEPVYGDDGVFAGYRGTARDVTAAKAAEREIRALNADLEERVRQRTGQLERSNSELQAFAYSVAHDLRGPLTSINGFTHLLERNRGASPDDEVRRRHALERIRAVVKHMDELTHGLLALAQLARVGLRWTSVDLGELALLVNEHLKIGNEGRDVRLQVDPGMITNGDKVLMRQLLENLLGNAWKFTAREPVGQIHLGRESDGQGGVRFFVRDNGVGFDAAQASGLFGAFHRFHKVSEFPGNGVGLATVHRIVTRHGGTVWAESVPGGGATFYFTLGKPPPGADF